MIKGINQEDQKAIKDLAVLFPAVDWSPIQKYFDPVVQISRNLDYASFMGLDRGPNLRILEIASGAGYLALVLRQLGHNVELSDIDPTSHKFGQAYQMILSALGFHLNHLITIKAHETVFPQGQKYDLIVGVHLFTFHEWGLGEWKDFVKTVDKSLVPGGRVILLINEGP